jgi:hypothetical protein
MWSGIPEAQMGLEQSRGTALTTRIECRFRARTGRQLFGPQCRKSRPDLAPAGVSSPGL